MVQNNDLGPTGITANVYSSQKKMKNKSEASCLRRKFDKSKPHHLKNNSIQNIQNV